MEDVDAPSQGGLETIEGASILSLTSLGFSGKIPLFLKPLRILTGVIELAPTKPAIDPEVITLPGFSITYLRQALAYPGLKDLKTPISKGCNTCDV